MVVAELKVERGPLAGKTVAQLRDESSVMVIHLVKRGGETSFDPVGACPVEEGDQVTVQATLNAWEGLRDKLRAA